MWRRIYGLEENRMPMYSPKGNPLGDRFILFDDPYLLYWAGQLSDRRSGQRRVNKALRRIYPELWKQAFRFLLEQDGVETNVTTPMADYVPEEDATCTFLSPPKHQELVVVDVLSAGFVPAEVIRRRALEVYDEHRVHIDHIGAERVTDGVGRVVGTDISTFKSACVLQNATLIVPDPVGATGTSLVMTIKRYYELERELGQRFTRCLILHLVVVHQALKAIAALDDPRIHVFAARMDKGLTIADPERGIPGGYVFGPGVGGVGERSNGRIILGK